MNSIYRQNNLAKRVRLQRLPWFVGVLAAVQINTLQADSIDFSRDIQPILSENCYFCHGQDSNQRQADLRLDIEEDANQVLEAGNAESSELFQRICSSDADEAMPPPDSNRKLTAEQVELIRRWIDEGARWDEHWAFKPIAKATVPQNQAIDWFISKEHKRHGLDFSPSADRATLIRRVSIDLTGLPPSIEQIEAFQRNNSPRAYEEMVDIFLSSPAYGERMAWDWLDAARYADTNGYQGDNERTMWPWRDWVIQAYNENMPFDQFSIWQLAGDLLPNATDEQILATAFLRNHPINGEGGRIAAENRVDYVMDMAETTGTVWMGLTFNCCRCHDHKYDPLTQEDYYSLFAFFNQTPVDGSGGNAQTAPVLTVPSNEQRQKQAALEAEVKDLQRDLQSYVASTGERQSEWETTVRKTLAASDSWIRLEAQEYSAAHATLEKQNDASILSKGANSDTDVYRVVGTTSLQTVTAVRLEALADTTMTGGGLSRSPSSNFVLTDFSVFLVNANGQPEESKISHAAADFEQHPVSQAIDEDPQTGWAVWAKEKDMRQNHQAIFYFAAPIEVPAASEWLFVLKHESEHKQHNLGRFRISLTDREGAVPISVPPDLATAVRNNEEQRSADERVLVQQAFLHQDALYNESKKRIEVTQAALSKLQNAFPKVMVMEDQSEPRQTFVLKRGSYQEPLQKVSARTPEMFGALSDDAPRSRLTLANWLFSSTNPLTARIAANRLWAQVFGTGLVKTSEDLGVQGEPPSHPELLDWLAAEYHDSGWDTKHMLRLILTSRTYRQSAKLTPHLIEIDPDNRLLARSPRYRLPSWMIRDYTLASSGVLVDTLGGPPVKSYQPAGVWEEASFGKKAYQLGAGEDLYRRSIYTFWRRIAAPTMFFDNADRMSCSVKGYRTNTPLHALSTLNDIAYVEAARLLATNILNRKLSTQESIQLIFQRVLGREIGADEEEVLVAGLERTRKQFQSDSGSAERFVNLGESPTDSDLSPVELASWTSLAMAIQNLDEALTRP